MDSLTPLLMGKLIKTRNAMDTAVEKGARRDPIDPEIFLSLEETREWANQVSQVINAMQQHLQDEAEKAVRCQLSEGLSLLTEAKSNG
jgi:hypothetical protein